MRRAVEILYVIFELAAALWASSERCCSLVYLDPHVTRFRPRGDHERTHSILSSNVLSNLRRMTYYLSRGMNGDNKVQTERVMDRNRMIFLHATALPQHAVTSTGPRRRHHHSSHHGSVLGCSRGDQSKTVSDRQPINRSALR